MKYFCRKERQLYRVGEQFEWGSGAEFTKYFHNSSTIFPTTILPQANPDAPNEEELWKNCRNILQARAAGKNCGKIGGD
jgi:hypothetical protein